MCKKFKEPKGLEMNETLEQEQTTVQDESTTSEQLHPQGQGEDTPTIEEILDWTKDKKTAEGGLWYNKEMKAADPNLLYKSFRGIEPEWKQFREVLSQNELKDVAGLSEKLKLLQEFENPETPKNQLLSLIESYTSNDKYNEMLVRAFQDIEQQKLRDKWGESMPQEVLQKLEELDGYKSMFERQEQDRAFQADVENIQKTLTESFEKVFQLAEEHQIDLDMQQFIDHCKENKIAPEYIEAEFLKQSLPSILKAKEIKTAESIQGNLQANQKAGITTATKAQPPKPQTVNEKIQSGLDGFFKKYNIE